MAELCHQGKSRNIDQIDYVFHHAIVRASGHKRLLRAYESAHILIVGPKLKYAHLEDNSPGQIEEDHLKIVNLIEAGDADGAERAAYDHIAQSIIYLEKIFDQHTESASSGRRGGRSSAKNTATKKEHP